MERLVIAVIKGEARRRTMVVTEGESVMMLGATSDEPMVRLSNSLPGMLVELKY